RRVTASPMAPVTEPACSRDDFGAAGLLNRLRLGSRSLPWLVASRLGNFFLGSDLDSSVCSRNSPLDPTARFNTTTGRAIEAATILGSSVCLAKPCWKALWLMPQAPLSSRGG